MFWRRHVLVKYDGVNISTGAQIASAMMQHKNILTEPRPAVNNLKTMNAKTTIPTLPTTNARP
jgi:septal ring-binding cell division protein DamX